MNTNRINSQKGIAQLAVIAVMAFLALGIPATTKLVQQNQENRSKATSNGISERTTTIINPTRVPTRPPITRVPTQTPPPIPTETSKVSIFHNFAPKDYSIRRLGSVLVNDILIKTEGRKIDTATVVYCYTDLLKPDFNSITGEQIASVISNKEIGNNCAEVKVTFNDKELNDSFPPYENLRGYVISYKATVVKYGRGMVKIDCSKTSLIDENGKEVSVEDFYCEENGTDFTLSDPQNISPTPSPISKPTRIPTRRPTIIPVSGIKVSPTSLKMKVGQSQNLTYILTPSKSTDTVTWSTSAEGVVRIQKITAKCSDNTNAKCIDAPGINHLQVTALKPGTVEIKLTTRTGKSAIATVVISDKITPTPPPTSSSPKCGLANDQFLNEYPSKEKLCAIGVPSEVALNKTTMVYTWQCRLDDKKVSCLSNPRPNKPQIIDGACGTVKYSELTLTSDKDKPEILCKSGKVSEFQIAMRVPCSCPPNISDCKCPENNLGDFYTWKCLGINGGKSVQCKKTSPTTIPITSLVPATNISLVPKTLTVRVGQNQNLTYILTPSNSTDTVKWSTTGTGQVRIQKINLKCARPIGTGSATKCMDSPGSKYLLVTGLKAGTVNLKLTTSRGRTATSTVVVRK